MAYDEDLGERIRTVLAEFDSISERKMFGGLAFMRHGNMVCGAMGENLMLRLGPHGADAALEEPHARPMDFTGRPLKSMVYVDPGGIATDQALAVWITRALDFEATLPPKS